MAVGGSSSGKSVYAEKLVLDFEKELALPVTYVATGTITDEEFARRVEKHRLRRPSNWKIIEEPIELQKVLLEKADKNEILMIDGIGTWVTNLMYRDYPKEFSWNTSKEKEFAQIIRQFGEFCKNYQGLILLVADEVGMGVIPEHREARIFRDLNGQANQILGEYAQEIFFVVCGVPMKIK